MHRQSEWKRACVRGRVVGGMALGDKRQHAARSKKHGKQQEKSRLEGLVHAGLQVGTGQENRRRMRCPVHHHRAAFFSGGEGPGQRKGMGNGRERGEGEGGSDGVVWAWFALGLASSPRQVPTKAWTLGAWPHTRACGFGQMDWPA